MTRLKVVYAEIGYSRAAPPQLRGEMPRCIQEHDHTIQPTGYLQWHEWAERMAKTNDQRLCPSCRLWVVWVPKQ